MAVGLGNPGKEYERSRHNAGARAVEDLARRLATPLKSFKRIAAIGETNVDAQRLVVARPNSFMNESGRAVGQLLRWFKASPENLIVIHDDADLKRAILRLKRGGGSGGHHGIESIEREIKNRDFYRIRIGVGRPDPNALVPPEFLLESMSPDEAEQLAAAEGRAADAVLSLMNDGLDAAMNRFNTR